METHLQPILDIENRDRDDVFKKAFRKNREDFLDGLLLMQGKSGFSGSRFTHHVQDKDKVDEQEEEHEQDHEIIDELNSEATPGAETGEEDEADPRPVEGQPGETETPGVSTKRRFSGEVTISRVSNDLDHSDEDDEHLSDEGLEEHEKELSQQHAAVAAGDASLEASAAEPDA